MRAWPLVAVGLQPRHVPLLGACGLLLYFCFHCRQALGNGMPCMQCPERNDRATRNKVKQAHNQYNAAHPIELDSE